MGEGKRSEKVADLIRKEISELLLKSLKDPRIGFVTITRVLVSEDCRSAKVYFSVMGSLTERERSEKGLASARGFIRKEIGRRIGLRYTPDIVFQVRDDGSGTPAPVFVCQNAELTAGTGGSTVTGLSSFALDASTPAATQTFPLLILGLSDIEDNELGDYAIWDVLLNTCYNATGLYLGITCT